ncbi:MAG: type II secretion system protein GspC [Xanthomonadales bacterium]|nr:type II secretion system protein GspC [Xanthomonadales bacterium]
MASVIAFDGGPHRPWPALLAVALLAIACLWLTIRLLATALSGPGAGDGSHALAPVAGPGSAAAAETLSGWHLFGSAFGGGDPSSRAAQAPETEQALVLVGVLAEGDPGAGVALVADAAGGQAYYRVGAELPGGSRLRAVLPDRVLLERNGVEESLSLLRPQGAAPGLPAAARTGEQAALDRMPALLGVVPQAGMAAGGEVDWQAVQRQIAVDPAELARQVQVLPVIENGQIAGVRLSGGAAAPLVQRLGLQPDDIVTAVNGIDVRDPARAQEILASVRDAGRVSVTLRRDGRSQTLNVDLK